MTTSEELARARAVCEDDGSSRRRRRSTNDPVSMNRGSHTEYTFCRICEALCGLEAQVDDGRIVAAERIEVCEETGCRVLADELVACQATGRRVVESSIVVCPVTGHRVVASEMVSCGTCGQTISPTAIERSRTDLLRWMLALWLTSAGATILSRLLRPGLTLP